MSSLVLLGLLGLLFIAWKYFNETPKGKPIPGPRGLPLIGNGHQIGNRMHIAFQKWAKEYGSIFKIRLGLEKVVVLDDYKMIKDFLNEPVFSGRPQNELATQLTEGSYGVINSEGEAWETQRRFTLRHLRDFGFGKNYMESLIIEEVKEIVDWLKREEGHSVSVNRKLSLAVLNALWSITSGKRFAQDDSTLTDMMDTATETFSQLFESGLLIFAPWLRFVIPEYSGWNKMQETVTKMVGFFKRTVEEHKTTYQDGHIRDFVDNYLHEIEKTEDSNSSFYKEIGYKNLVATVGDLFQAGSETTSNTLAWAVLYLTAHPKIQEKMQKEIDAVVGKSRLPSLADRPQMPYTEAVIMETLRKSSLAPTGVFHRALATKEFQGYVIEKGTWIMTNLYSVHHNVDIWGDPQNFRPERFLSEDGKTAKKHEALIPFQIGKRQCLGEPLAKDTIFLFLASIFQRFYVTPDPSNPTLDFEPIIGFLLLPKKFHVVMKDRWD